MNKTTIEWISVTKHPALYECCLVIRKNNVISVASFHGDYWYDRIVNCVIDDVTFFCTISSLTVKINAK